MIKRQAAIWLVLILLLAAFFRFWDLENTPPGLWADEAVNGVNALEAISKCQNFEISKCLGGWKVFYPENFGREGLFINIQSLFVAALGTEPWVLRLPSAIFGILTVLGLYLMTKELFRGYNSSPQPPPLTLRGGGEGGGVTSFLSLSRSERIALFSAFFLATSFWHIMFSRIGFRAIMAPFFLIWAFYFLFKGIRITHPLLFALAGLAFGLGFHTYIAYRIAPLIALYPLWLFYRSWKISPPPHPLPLTKGEGQGKGVYSSSWQQESACAPCLIIIFIIMALLAASPLLLYYAENPQDFFGRTSAISVFESQNPLLQFVKNLGITLAMFNFVGDFNWRHNLAGSPQLWWPVGLLFLIGIWLNFRKAWQSNSTPGEELFPFRFLLLWFAIMLLPVAASNEGLPHALRSIVLIPPAMIFAALGLERLTNLLCFGKEEDTPTPGGVVFFSCRPQFATALLVAFFIAATAHSYNTYFNRWAVNFNVYNAFQADITEKAQWLKKQPAEVKKYVLTTGVDSIDYRGRPMSLQPIIFITNTFFEKDRQQKNIYYLTASEINPRICGEEKTPPPQSLPLTKGEGQGEGVISPNCIIILVESNVALLRSLKQKIPGLRLDVSPGFVTFRK